MAPELNQPQQDAVQKMDNGKILYGGVGSGKTRAILAYYKKREYPRDIYVITTAKKRDTLDWLGEAAQFSIPSDLSVYEAADVGDEEGMPKPIITVDSWNNLKNYVEVRDAFFIFDEQRLVGHGAWVKAFIKIAKANHWVMLSATPGDNWLDYAAVFIANGYYRNITDFKSKHVLYEPYISFPKIKGYLNEHKLNLLRNEVLVEMPMNKHTIRHMNYLDMTYDKDAFKRVFRDRWHIYEDRPIKDAAEMFRLMRRVVNSDPSRLEQLRWLIRLCHDRLIVFYNFDYELEILRGLRDETEVYELNGHRHDPLPSSDKWVYLVQYVAGAEAWNCVTTDATVLWSLTYSYKNFEQAQGRIDRLDTQYVDLYYYIFVSNSIIDRAIRLSLEGKQDFNERKWMRETGISGWVSEGENSKNRRFSGK